MARNEMTDLLALGGKLIINSSFGRGRGVFSTQFIPPSTIITTVVPLVSLPNSILKNNNKLRLDRVCNHCYQSNKLPLCHICSHISDKEVISPLSTSLSSSLISSSSSLSSSPAQLYHELKQHHKIILRLKDSFQYHFKTPNTLSELLLYKLLLRICHEIRHGYQNTIYFIESFIEPNIPDISEETEEALEEDYDFIYSSLQQLGYEEEIKTFLTLDWYIRTLGVLYLNSISTNHGTALYDSITMINHSCQPNVILEFQGNSLNASIKSISNIQEDEELFLDYTTIREEYQQYLESQNTSTGTSSSTGMSTSTSDTNPNEKKNIFLKELYGFNCYETCTCR